jgi:2-polyprenyl-3-methyl-5-hydroxy-6-metoxy-1,4-benzoquinol methylase
VITLTAGEIVRGNATYDPGALDILGMQPTAAFPIVACTACGFVYARLLPEDAVLQRLYDDAIDEAKARAESQSPSWMAHQLRLASTLLERFDGRAVARVLDYGCGYGVIVRALRAPTIECMGYEIARGPLVSARDEGLLVTDSLDEVSDSAPFDGIILSDVLEHVANPATLLRACGELLRTDGWLVVSVPDFSPRRLERIARGEIVTPELNPWEHLNYFAPETLSRMLERAGFDVRSDLVPPDFGFRPREKAGRRWANTLKSAGRMIDYSLRPRATSTMQLARKH